MELERFSQNNESEITNRTQCVFAVNAYRILFATGKHRVVNAETFTGIRSLKQHLYYFTHSVSIENSGSIAAVFATFTG